MRSLRTCFALLVLAFLAPGSLAHAQAKAAAGKPAKKRSTAAKRPATATRAEVQELRKEVAAQKQTIDDLKAMVQRLVEANQQAAAAAQQAQASAVQARSAAGQAQNTATQAQSAAEKAQLTANRSEVGLAEEKKATQAVEKKVSAVGLQSGWNGEHFYLKSADGNFQIQPYGYLQLDHRAFSGDGVPPNNFVVRRARFGFQGNYGTHYDYAMLIDFAAANNIVIRDFYINVKYRPELQFQFGQFKEPFAQELLTAATNLDFVERSLASLLYPSPTAFRSPGAAVHGDISGGVVQYWVGAFNGKGVLTNNTTSEPEVIGRLRFYPWKKTNGLLQGLAFGGAVGHGRTRGLSSESSFSGALPNGVFTFFSSTRINGPVERYNGELTWTKGRAALRAEYNQLNQFRRSLGVGFTDLAGVVGKGYYAQATYLLTGEKRPENGQPKPRHPFLTGEHGIGAWELKFRYSNLQAAAGKQENRVDEFSAGINWYPTAFVRYMIDFNVERVKNPTLGNPIVLLPQRFLAVLQRVQFRF
jgi:phosphate-selective porin OprO/OprP